MPGVLLATDYAKSESVTGGGPLGDLIQWADLIAGLYILGHNVTIMKDIYQVSRGLIVKCTFLLYLGPQLHQCQHYRFNMHCANCVTVGHRITCSEN